MSTTGSASRRLMTLGALLLAAACVGGCRTREGPDENTQKWIVRLNKGDREQRENAVRVLAQKRGKELHVVPALIEALDDRDPIVAKSAAEGLRTLLGKPDLSDQRTAWEEYWRRTKKRYEKDDKRSPEERMKLEKAALESDRGFLYMAQGQFKLAEGFFLEAVALDPEDPKYWNNLGKCRTNMGMLPDAVDSFRNALERDPGYVPAHYNLGEAFLKISKVTGSDRTYEALGHAEAAIKLDGKSTNWEARWLKARILLHMAITENRPTERELMYRQAWKSISEAIGIVELTKDAGNTAQVRKTAALIAYGRELHYQAYKELKRVYDLGYQMDQGFVAKLEEALRREAYKTGAQPPEMPHQPKKDERKGPPPALRMPFGDGSE